MSKTIAYGGMALLMTACATGYQSSGLTGGFEDRLISNQPTVYEVRFLGNGVTAHNRARDFVLLRGAELMLASGHTRFVVSNAASGYGSDKWFEGAKAQGTVFNPRESVVVREGKSGEGFDACSVVADVIQTHGIKAAQLERSTTLVCNRQLNDVASK